jgi:hypothetical protein
MSAISKPTKSGAETATTDLFLSHAKANEKFALDLLAVSFVPSSVRTSRNITRCTQYSRFWIAKGLEEYPVGLRTRRAMSLHKFRVSEIVGLAKDWFQQS